MSSAVSNATQSSNDQIGKASADAKDKAKEASDAASKQGEDAANRASAIASHVTQNAKESLSSAQESAQSKASEVSERANDGSQQLKEAANDASEKAKSGAADISKESKEAGNKLYEQATALASNTVEYIKSAAGLAQNKASDAKDRALSEVDKNSNSNNGPTVGGLVNQARDLTGEALGTVKSYVGAGSDKAQNAAEDAKDKAKEVKGDLEGKVDNGSQNSYIEQARNLAANVIGQAQNVISTAGKKVEENVPDKNSKPVTEQASDAAKSLQEGAANQASNIQAKGKEAVDVASKNLEDLSIKGNAYAKAGAEQLGKAAESVRAQ